MPFEPVGPKSTTRTTQSQPQEPPHGGDLLIVGGVGGRDDALALREAIADVTGHDPWVYTVEESIAQLREWAKRQRSGDQIKCQRAEIERLRADLARVEAERADALARAEQAEAALAHYRDGQWRGDAALQQTLLDYAREVTRYQRTQDPHVRACAIALYGIIDPMLGTNDPRRRAVEQLRALLTGGPDAN